MSTNNEFVRREALHKANSIYFYGMEDKKWYVIRVTVGDYAYGETGFLYKEVCDIFKSRGTIGYAVYESVDAWSERGYKPTSSLFGGHGSSKAIAMETLVGESDLEDLLNQIKSLAVPNNNHMVITKMAAEVVVFGDSINQA